MSGIDNRIVTMQFNNRQFEDNAATSLSTLQKLKDSMNFGSIVGGTIKGLGAIDGALSKIGLKTPFSPMIKAANSGLGMIGGVLDKLGIKNPFSKSLQGASELQRGAQQAAGGMGVLDGAVTGVSGKFVALATVAITALSNITNRAINSAGSFLKGFTFGPILDGLHEYETNLKAIQTVQANTDRPLTEINRSLDELNRYSDQTIYNFGEMARNVGTFTAAGVDLKTSVSSIKGIANLAALSGASSQQAATAMYQLSQAIASGKVGLMDWNSVVNAGMGGKKLQNALAQTAVAMGEINSNAVKMEGPMKKLTINGQSFRESLMSAGAGGKSWLSSDVLVNTLAVMDGRFSAAALAAEKTETGLRKYSDAQIEAKIQTARTNLEQKNGVKYTDAQFKALQQMSTQAFESAQKVKTLGQVFDIAKETIGSGWSASFRNIFGNLDQAKELFTGMSEGLNDIINKNATARNTLLVAWSKGGGRATVIEGLSNAWKAFYSIIQAVSKGFRDIFPRKTSDDLLSMSNSFRDFMKQLIPGKDTLANIRDIAGGVFAVFGIGKTILGGVITMFKTMFTALGGGSGNFLDLAGGIGNALKGLNAFLKKSGIVAAFFTGLGHILSIPLRLLSNIAKALTHLFDGFDSGGATDAVDRLAGGFNRLDGMGDRLRKSFGGLSAFFGRLGKAIGKALMGIGEAIAASFNGASFDRVLEILKTGLLGGILLTIRSFFKKGAKIDLTGGLFDGIKKTLGEATQAFQNMQTNLKADILSKLAVSIGMMAAALWVLSTIDPGALSKALGAMAGGFGVLIGAMFALMKVMGPVGIIQMYVTTQALVKMSLAILVLAAALKTLSGIKFGDMLRGLFGLSWMMRILTKSMLPLAAGSSGMIKAAGAMIFMGVAINLLAVALKILASIDLLDMAKGLAGMAAMLYIVSQAIQKMPAMGVQAVSLIALGAAINLLAVALKIFGSMSLAEMAKGLVALALSLTIIALAIDAMPATMILQAAGLLVVSSALVILATALKVMGSMSWTAIAKGLVMLAGAMTILALGLDAMGVMGFVGAAALVVTAAALTVLVPMLVMLGAMSWSMIIKSLVALAGVFTVLGLAGYILAPVVPVILALGVAILLVGAGAALAGAGLFLAASGIAALTAAGAAGVGVMVGALRALIGMIPMFGKKLGEGLVNMVKSIGRVAPSMINAMSRILSSMLRAVIKNVPLMGKMFTTLIQTAVKVINKNAPAVISAGFRMLINFLRKIEQNIGRITSIAANIVIKFMNAIGKKAPAMAQSGARMIINFVNATARAIDRNSAAMGRAGGRLAVAIVRGMASGIANGSGVIAQAAASAAKKALSAAKNFLGIHSPSRKFRNEVGKPISQGLAGGIDDASDLPIKSVQDMGKAVVSKMSRVMEGVEDAFAMDPNLNPTISPVLDLGALTQEANKMSSILATAPIIASASFQTASDISAMTQASSGDDGGPGSGGSGGGDKNVTFEQHLHSPKPIDSVEAYRGGKTLISLVKETLP